MHFNCSLLRILKKNGSFFLVTMLLCWPHCNIIKLFLASVDPVWLGNCVVVKIYAISKLLYPWFLYIMNVPCGSDWGCALPVTAVQSDISTVVVYLYPKFLLTKKKKLLQESSKCLQFCKKKIHFFSSQIHKNLVDPLPKFFPVCIQ